MEVPLQNSLSVIHQSHDYPCLCSSQYVADYTEKKKKLSNLIFEKLPFFFHSIYFLTQQFQKVQGDCT